MFFKFSIPDKETKTKIDRFLFTLLEKTLEFKRKKGDILVKLEELHTIESQFLNLRKFFEIKQLPVGELEQFRQGNDCTLAHLRQVIN